MKIPPRPSSRKPGVFAPVSAEPTFQDRTPCARVWAPSGLAGEDVGLDMPTDDVEMPSEKARGGRHGGVRPKKHRTPVPRKPPAAHGRSKRKAQVLRDSLLDPLPAPAIDACNPLDPSAPVPARIAAMDEASRYFFHDWRKDALSHGQACSPHTRVHFTCTENPLISSHAQVSAHMSDDEVIAAFTKDTGQRVPRLSQDPSYPLDPKLLVPSKVPPRPLSSPSPPPASLTHVRQGRGPPSKSSGERE